MHNILSRSTRFGSNSFRNVIWIKFYISQFIQRKIFRTPNQIDMTVLDSLSLCVRVVVQEPHAQGALGDLVINTALKYSGGRYQWHSRSNVSTEQ